MNRLIRTWTWRLGLALALALTLAPPGGMRAALPAAAPDRRTFPETGQSVRGTFLAYWDQHGGLPQQGYPISTEMQERSATDGKTYTVQYFERAVFELHPENQPPNDVLLALLGVFLYNQTYPAGAPGQTANTQAGSRLFLETGKRVGGAFLDYWTTHGGLAQQGFPISEEFNEVSALDGKTYKVQYFQRAVFESHPENKPPYDVLLSQLGTFRYRGGHLQPTPLPPPQAIPQPAEYAAVRAKFETMTPAQYKAAGYTTSSLLCEAGIGASVENGIIAQAHFDTGQLDPQNPPELLLTGNRQRVIGLRWTANGDLQPPPVLFGQQLTRTNLGPGEMIYMLASYFKPDGHVLFAIRDPDFSCSQP